MSKCPDHWCYMTKKKKIWPKGQVKVNKKMPKYVCAYILVPAHTCVCITWRQSACVPLYICVSRSVCVHACMSVCICICMCVYACAHAVCVYVYMIKRTILLNVLVDSNSERAFNK